MEYTQTEFRDKLIRFFHRHAPSKMHVVPKIVQRFRGHEEEVFEHLTHKYTEIDDKNHVPKTEGTSYFDVPGSANSGGTPSGE